MLFDNILRNEALLNINVIHCSENDIEVCLCPNINSDNVMILKIDDFYSTKNKMRNPPPSIDCLILIKCEKKDCYNIYLVELKDICSQNHFDIKNIEAKFKTTIDDFLGKRFESIFANEKYCHFECFFITDPYKCLRQEMSQEEYLEHIHAKGLKLDYFLSMEPLEYQGKISIINPMLPSPMISSC